MLDRVVGGLTAAAWGAFKLIIAVSFVVALFIWATDNPEDFGRVLNAVLDATGNVIVLAANWIAEQADSAAAA